jgi:hypothetical protein
MEVPVLLDQRPLPNVAAQPIGRKGEAFGQVEPDCRAFPKHEIAVHDDRNLPGRIVAGFEILGLVLAIHEVDDDLLERNADFQHQLVDRATRLGRRMVQKSDGVGHEPLPPVQWWHWSMRPGLRRDRANA